MIPIRDIKPEEIRGVLYIDDIILGQMDKITFIMMNGASYTFHGDDLPVALKLAKERFPAEPGSPLMADQPLKD